MSFFTKVQSKEDPIPPPPFFFNKIKTNFLSFIPKKKKSLEQK